MGFHTIPQSIGGTGVSPVQAQTIAFAINSFPLKVFKSP